VKRIVLTDAAIEAIIAACESQLAGEEGEGDCADVKHKNLQRASDWSKEQLARRAARRAARERNRR
jgi:hypothetical protein